MAAVLMQPSASFLRPSLAARFTTILPRWREHQNGAIVVLTCRRARASIAVLLVTGLARGHGKQVASVPISRSFPTFAVHRADSWLRAASLRRELGARQGREDERARSSASVLVGTLAVKKPLFLNVRRERLLGTLLGKKPCVINKQVDSERFRSTPRTWRPLCGRLNVSWTPIWRCPGLLFELLMNGLAPREGLSWETLCGGTISQIRTNSTVGSRQTLSSVRSWQSGC